MAYIGVFISTEQFEFDCGSKGDDNLYVYKTQQKFDVTDLISIAHIFYFLSCSQCDVQTVFLERPRNTE